MHSWADVAVPQIEGTGPQLSLYDSATDEVRPTAPGERATMYVCGITPYDATHLGHAATYLAFDLVQRVWRDLGKQVDYVQNVTDVDDPLIERAARDNIPWEELAQRETDLFRSDMEALRILPPGDYLGAVETIPLVTDAVTTLLDDGAAYRLEDGSGDIYFDISKAPRFGYVSRYDEATMDELFAERGGDPDREGKRHRLDPLLWKGERPGDPAWPTQLGSGRPGWHIECAAIALKYLGEQIDLQGGGADLRFPHHEMSVAHAEKVTGREPFADHYTQAGMIGYDGHKMSKSLGNLVRVSELTQAGTDPMAIRLALLHGHYRHDREWTDELLHEAEAQLARWRMAVGRDTASEAAPVIATLRERLADDLDTPGALAIIDAWVGAEGPDPDAPKQLSEAIDALLGIAL